MPLENLQVQSYILYKPDFLPAPVQMSHTVTLERRSQREGADRWAIYKAGSVLYKSDKDFGYESMPSSRTMESLSETRFDSAQEAFDFWETEMKNQFDKELREIQAVYTKSKKIIHK